jgi:hypothetical protein
VTVTTENLCEYMLNCCTVRLFGGCHARRRRRCHIYTGLSPSNTEISNLAHKAGALHIRCGSDRRCRVKRGVCGRLEGLEALLSLTRLIGIDGKDHSVSAVVLPDGLTAEEPSPELNVVSCLI